MSDVLGKIGIEEVMDKSTCHPGLFVGVLKKPV
jgi:hypothetical protein